MSGEEIKFLNKMPLKIKYLLIFFICVARFIIFGKANKKIKSPKKIAIMQTAKLGDMVCTTPMFRAVKEKYPESRLFVIGNKINKEVLEGNPDVDEYIVWKNNFWGLLKNIKKEKIDFACDTNPSFLGLATLYLAGVPLIASPVIKNGFSPVETRLYKMLRKFVVAVPHHMGNYAPREYLRLLEPVGIFSDNTKKYLYFTKQADEAIKKFFISNEIDISKDFVVGISPSVGNKVRKWGGKKFAEVADYLYDKYKVKIIIIGTKSDKDEVEEMVNNIDKNTKVINTFDLFCIDELKAVISKLNLFISVESDPVFIAEVFNVPIVNLVGPVDDNNQSPKGKKFLIVKIDRSAPEIHVMNAIVYNYKEARRQIEEITVEMVVVKIDEIMSLIYNNAIYIK